MFTKFVKTIYLLGIFRRNSENFGYFSVLSNKIEIIFWYVARLNHHYHFRLDEISRDLFRQFPLRFENKAYFWEYHIRNWYHKWCMTYICSKIRIRFIRNPFFQDYLQMALRNCMHRLTSLKMMQFGYNLGIAIYGALYRDTCGALYVTLWRLNIFRHYMRLLHRNTS